MTARRVLIVEDEMVVQLHLVRIVSELGHEVVGTAMNTREALEVVARETPDLVLMDIHLADGDDGVETAKKLVRGRDFPVIFCTAYADEATLKRVEEVGAAGYLVKPFTAPAVRAALSTALASHARLSRARGEARALANILESLSDALFVVDGAGKVSFANPRAVELTGWPVHEAYGRDLLEVLKMPVDAERERVRQALSGVRAERAVRSVSDLTVREDAGAQRHFDLEFEPVLDEDAPEEGVIVKLKDRGRAEAPAAAPAAPVRVKRPFGKGTRILIYSHDTFGLGHLRRCLSLVRSLCARYPEASALLVTGSPMVHRYPMPSGADYVKLPALRKVESEQYEARTLNITGSEIRNMRSNLILHTLRDFDPNVLLVDHSPTGSKGELMPALEWLSERGGCTRILGLRDILDEPESVKELWQKTGVYDVLRKHYDHLVVYGNRSVYDPPARYDFPPDVAARTRFVDYVCDKSAADEPTPAPGGKPLVVVSIGGGDGGGETVILPFLQMMRRHKAELDFRAEILTGPFLEPELEARARALADGLPVEIKGFIPSTAALFRSADLVVATTGYNTTTDLMLYARAALFIPRVMYRKEQLLRAERLAYLGLADYLGPDEVTPERLFSAIRSARAAGKMAKARAEGRLFLDGAEHFADFLGTLEVESAP
ncbi:MAG: response regulator [Planctomycetota bacterium]